jgi:hypothetical protein
MEQEWMNEFERWKYFDFVRLPMNQEIHTALNQNPMDEKLIQEHILAYLTNRFIKQPIDFSIENKDSMFDYENTAKLMGVKARECAERIETKKFALVVPFPFIQIEDTLKLLKRWEKTVPCKGKAKVYQEKTDLIFYYHRQRYEAMEQLILKALSSDHTTNGTLKPEFHCFNSNIHFIYSNLLLHEDVYPDSASRMFYKLIDDNLMYTQYSYFFYNEPDTYPIKDGWLNRILDQAYLPTTQWWISGSIYRGKLSYVRDGRGEDDLRGGNLLTFQANMHINGNALYNLCSNFRDFTLDVRKMMDMRAYDTAFTTYLTNYGWRLTRKLWHHFLYSDFILNMWRTPWNEQDILWQSPNTYLVHGKLHKQK